MAGDNVTISSSPIGSSQPDLSKYLLSSDAQLAENYYRLHGYVKTIQKNGSIGWDRKEELAFNPACISFMDSKLVEIMSKEQKLSRYNSIQEMNKEGLTMVLMFVDELYLKLKEFEITNTDDYLFLKNMYSNLTSQAVRHALFQKDSNLLSSTTSETTSKIQQNITEQSRKGGLGGLLNGLIGG